MLFGLAAVVAGAAEAFAKEWPESFSEVLSISMDPLK
jgi:hypothetical protein